MARSILCAEILAAVEALDSAHLLSVVIMSTIREIKVMNGMVLALLLAEMGKLC